VRFPTWGRSVTETVTQVPQARPTTCDVGSAPTTRSGQVAKRGRLTSTSAALRVGGFTGRVADIRLYDGALAELARSVAMNHSHAGTVVGTGGQPLMIASSCQ
jgi:hypothetical protein